MENAFHVRMQFQTVPIVIHDQNVPLVQMVFFLMEKIDAFNVILQFQTVNFVLHQLTA